MREVIESNQNDPSGSDEPSKESSPVGIALAAKETRLNIGHILVISVHPNRRRIRLGERAATPKRRAQSLERGYCGSARRRPRRGGGSTTADSLPLTEHPCSGRRRRRATWAVHDLANLSDPDQGKCGTGAIAFQNRTATMESINRAVSR